MWLSYGFTQIQLNSTSQTYTLTFFTSHHTDRCSRRREFQTCWCRNHAAQRSRDSTLSCHRQTHRSQRWRIHDPRKSAPENVRTAHDWRISKRAPQGRASSLIPTIVECINRRMARRYLPIRVRWFTPLCKPVSGQSLLARHISLPISLIAQAFPNDCFWSFSACGYRLKANHS